MKAPDKLILTPYELSDIGFFDIDEREVEYIRKDALLEWAKENFELYADICTRTINDVYLGYMDAFSMIINKIESL